MTERGGSIEHCRRLIRELPCPRPMNCDPSDLTVGGCVDLKHCGCEYGVACGYEAPPFPAGQSPEEGK